MSTRRRIPSKSTEDVSGRHCQLLRADHKLSLFMTGLYVLLGCSPFDALPRAGAGVHEWKLSSEELQQVLNVTGHHSQQLPFCLCLLCFFWRWNCACLSSFASSLLKPLWDNSVKILHQVSTQHPQTEGLMVFCQRLLYTLQVGALLQCIKHRNVSWKKESTLPESEGFPVRWIDHQCEHLYKNSFGEVCLHDTCGDFCILCHSTGWGWRNGFDLLPKSIQISSWCLPTLPVNSRLYDQKNQFPNNLEPIILQSAQLFKGIHD